MKLMLFYEIEVYIYKSITSTILSNMFSHSFKLTNFFICDFFNVVTILCVHIVNARCSAILFRLINKFANLLIIILYI